jgi:hypothetical protein
MEMSYASVFWAKKVEINIIKSKCHIKNRYGGNFMIMWRRHIRHNQTVRLAVEYCMYI